MVFSSYVFLFLFLPTVLAIYYGQELVGRRAFPRALPLARSLLLLAASYVFYGWERYGLLTLLVGLTTVDFLCGLGMARAQDERNRRRVLLLSLSSNLGLLAFFKYRNLIIGTLDAGLQRLGLGHLDPVLPELALPMGISFFTFHSMGYTIDVYQRRVDAVPLSRAAHFYCFVALFPQLVAGPILRYRELADQFVERVHSLDRFARGMFLFMLGFGKKTLLANPAGILADSLFDTPHPGLLDSWCGVLGYSFQIYFDFSGYSDMALGLGLAFGFLFAPNFDAPYRSESITEFWRRWHISLSTWLRDYLYLPLGGNRRGRGRTYVNLALVMLLGGLWHGAAWTFLLWGAWHGALLAFERWRDARPLYAGCPRPVRILCTFLLVLVGWVIFRAESMSQLGQVLGGLFGAGGAGPLTLRGPYPVLWPLAMLAIGAAICFFGKTSQELARDLTWPRSLWAFAIFALGVGQMLLQGFNPFIYFQF